MHDRLGDLQYKKFGVTPEPEVRTKLLKGEYPTFTYPIVNENVSARRRVGIYGTSIGWHIIYPL
jgi:hypothetical protein